MCHWSIPSFSSSPKMQPRSASRRHCPRRTWSEVQTLYPAGAREKCCTLRLWQDGIKYSTQFYHKQEIRGREEQHPESFFSSETLVKVCWVTLYKCLRHFSRPSKSPAVDSIQAPHVCFGGRGRVESVSTQICIQHHFSGSITAAFRLLTFWQPFDHHSWSEAIPFGRTAGVLGMQVLVWALAAFPANSPLTFANGSLNQLPSFIEALLYKCWSWAFPANSPLTCSCDDARTNANTYPKCWN